MVASGREGSVSPKANAGSWDKADVTARPVEGLQLIEADVAELCSLTSGGRYEDIPLPVHAARLSAEVSR